MTDPYLAELERDCAEREAAEAEFRRTMKQRVAELAAERAFANRRMNVMRSLLQTVGQAQSREIALAGAVSALRQRLGWRDESPARNEVLAEYSRVADAAFAHAHPAGEAEAAGAEEASVRLVSDEAAPSLSDALAAFEAWYLQTRSTPFWVLFEHYMPETQLVDF